MTANPHRGEVEFTTSDGRAYVLKLSTNQMAATEDELQKLSGVTRLRRLVQIALEWKQPVSLEEAGDIIDDLGTVVVGDDVEFVINQHIEQTAWGRMNKSFADQAKVKEAKALAGVKPNGAIPGEGPRLAGPTGANSA